MHLDLSLLSCLHVCHIVLDTISYLHYHLRAALSPHLLFCLRRSVIVFHLFVLFIRSLSRAMEKMALAIDYRESDVSSSMWNCLARRMYYFKGQSSGGTGLLVLYQSHNRSKPLQFYFHSSKKQTNFVNCKFGKI